ncbi:hypothetical protein FA13DRAFT_1719019 [Coprinellus micaceus]|uniref:Uncharacterized protein n=1 Tax=Coprinellus micaceus TaxID=71717 RepID=A0A4Y7SD61_COPMI|nr:hypothetical protein FA13DRAFT_1719019 [Coprinellus micaceus]
MQSDYRRSTVAGFNDAYRRGMADGHGDGGYDCLCLGCHHLSETEEIFKNVATVIGVYKVADYRQKKLASDSHATPEQKRQAKRSLEEAVEALRDVVDDIDTLPPASKQQLVVLFQDMKSSALQKGLSKPMRPFYDNDYEDRTPPSPDADDLRPFIDFSGIGFF